jgi:hypothetical protein
VTEPQFDKTFEPAHGEAVPVASDVLRVTAPNAGPLTFHGTNSYIVGRDTLAVIDPGPEEESHWRTLEAAIAGRPVSHIFVTHTHRDHSPLTARLKQKTGATVVAEGPHRAARPLYTGEVNPLKESADMDFVPDIAAGHGQRDCWRRVGDRNAAYAGAHRQPRGLRAERRRHRPGFFRRSRDGLGDIDHRTAGRGDERLHGLARHAGFA